MSLNLLKERWNRMAECGLAGKALSHATVHLSNGELVIVRRHRSGKWSYFNLGKKPS